MQNAFDRDGGDSHIVSTSDRFGPAWENGEEGGTVRRLFKTLYDSLFNPAGFFRQMRRTDGYLNPLVYGIILGSFSTIVPIGWNLLLVSFSDAVLDTPPSQQMFMLSPELYGVIAILSPILVTIAAFAWSGILHVFLLLFGGAGHGFQTSFRVICYARSAGVWHIVPIFGPLIGSIWYIVLLVIGFVEAQESSVGKALAAILIPIFVWTILLVAIAVGMSICGLL